MRTGRAVRVRVMLLLSAEQRKRLFGYAKGIGGSTGRYAMISKAATEIYNKGEAYLMSDTFQNSLGRRHPISEQEAKDMGLSIIERPCRIGVGDGEDAELQ